MIAATDGALNYLQKLHGQFGDWQLALAAYNWGEGNVARADRARTSGPGLPTDYASLTMPDETRNYLPKLQAVKNIVATPRSTASSSPTSRTRRTSPSSGPARKIDVKRAAELAEMPVDEFQYLNPHHNRPVIAGADEHAILLPIDKAELFAAKLELTDQPLVSWQAYRMQPGETLAQVAAKFGMPVETLRAVNGIGARSRSCRAGTRCWCRRSGPTPQAEAALGDAVFTTVPQGRTFYYRVQRGDTLPAIAGALRGDGAGHPRAGTALAHDQRQGRAAAAHHQRPRAERGKVPSARRARPSRRRGQGCAGRQVGVEERQGDREGAAPRRTPAAA